MKSNRFKWVELLIMLVLATRPAPGGEKSPFDSDIQSEQSAARVLAPSALVAAPNGRKLFVACSGVGQIAIFDVDASRVVEWIRVGEAPSGLALSRDGKSLYVTCSGPESWVCLIDVATSNVTWRLAVGHTAMAPVLSPDEKTLFVCNRFNDTVSVIDLVARAEVSRVPVEREPVAADVTPDGRFLLVGNHLHRGRSDQGSPAASVSVVDTVARRVVKQIDLPRGSGLVRGIAISPDGNYAAVTHLLARYYLPTTEVDFGRINSNALSLLDVANLRMLGLTFLDNAAQGAANPWALAWTSDGESIVVTHAGAHQVSVVEASPLLQRRVGARSRLSLPGNGPRAIALMGSRIFVANYFSDNLSMIDLDDPHPQAVALELCSPKAQSLSRRGEALFNDATLCFQQWQSCASCHGDDARTDGLNWDLLNDGLGNPKNAKSLVWTHKTPPAMSLGVRDRAEVAVRAGIRHILFTDQPEEVPDAIDEYLKSLRPLPSPHLVDGKLSEAAERGRQIFLSARAGCADCHPPPLFTCLDRFDVGTQVESDRADDRFDTPTLVELWRTAPYLHSGAAATIPDVLTICNQDDLHGETSHLTPDQIFDLAEYLLSL